jgi:hypothetical protein
VLATRVVRAPGGLATCPNAGPIEPWLHLTARPYSLHSVLGIALSITVSTLEYCAQSSAKPLRTEPADQASRDCSAVTIQITRLATHWPQPEWPSRRRRLARFDEAGGMKPQHLMPRRFLVCALRNGQSNQITLAATSAAPVRAQFKLVVP